MAAGKCSGAAGTVTVTALPTATTGTASRTTRAATDLPRSTILETVQSNFTSARPTPGKSATTTVPGATITVPVQDPVVTHCPARRPPTLPPPPLARPDPTPPTPAPTTGAPGRAGAPRRPPPLCCARAENRVPPPSRAARADT